MLHSSFNNDGIVPCAFSSCIFFTLAAKILQCQRVFVFAILDTICNRTLENDFTTIDSCLRSNINQKVSSTHDLFIMLDNNNGITYVAQTFEHRYKSRRIPGMQTDARLVKNIQ